MNRNRIERTIRLLVAASIVAASVAAVPADEPGVEEQLTQMQNACETSTDARVARQAAKPLYDRLGGYDKIHALTVEIVRLHEQNPQIKRVLEGADKEALIKGVSDFVASATGGPQEYTGRDMVTAHKHLGLHDADFLAAGGDIVQAMKNVGYGQEEIDDLMCLVLPMKDMVVTK